MIDSEDWEFRERCQEYLKLSVDERIRRGFRYEYKPALDDAPYRVFKTMADYRAWCEANLPDYLGFKRRAKTVETRICAYDTDRKDAFEKLRRDGCM